MASRARIRTDFPSETDVASSLKLPAGRVIQLRRQLFDLHISHPDGSVTIVPFKRARPAAKLSRVKAAKTAIARSATKKRS